MARDVRVSFKLSEDKKNELQQFADDYGVTMSALCAILVGQWLYQQNKVINPIVSGLSDLIREQLQSLDKDTLSQMVDMAKEQNRA